MVVSSPKMSRVNLRRDNLKDIIDKYNGELPICPTNQEFNRTLKDLGQRIPELNIPFSKLITAVERLPLKKQ